MTKQEVKEERKETDGNPQIKQRIRAVQMEMARKRMMAAVPEADVIVTNPTHISVAIKYDAMAHAAPIVEDKPLARVLNKTVEIGQQIPDSLFKAVAEILAYVYQLKSGQNKS